MKKMFLKKSPGKQLGNKKVVGDVFCNNFKGAIFTLGSLFFDRNPCF